MKVDHVRDTATDAELARDRFVDALTRAGRPDLAARVILRPAPAPWVFHLGVETSSGPLSPDEEALVLAAGVEACGPDIDPVDVDDRLHHHPRTPPLDKGRRARH